MKKITSLLILLVTFSLSIQAQESVTVEKDQDGWKLLVDGEPFMVNGMNWDYFPRVQTIHIVCGINHRNSSRMH